MFELISAMIIAFLFKHPDPASPLVPLDAFEGIDSGSDPGLDH